MRTVRVSVELARGVVAEYEVEPSWPPTRPTARWIEREIPAMRVALDTPENRNAARALAQAIVDLAQKKSILAHGAAHFGPLRSNSNTGLCEVTGKRVEPEAGYRYNDGGHWKVVSWAGLCKVWDDAGRPAAK